MHRRYIQPPFQFICISIPPHLPNPISLADGDHEALPEDPLAHDAGQWDYFEDDRMDPTAYEQDEDAGGDRWLQRTGAPLRKFGGFRYFCIPFSCDLIK